MTTRPPDDCPECGAPPFAGLACRTMFETLMAYEYEDPACGAVHHITVLCYNLQHLRRFTGEALEWSRAALKTAIERGTSPAYLRRQARDRYEGSQRVLRAEPAPPPDHPRRWTKTVADVYRPDRLGHADRVYAWARAILADMEGQ